MPAGTLRFCFALVLTFDALQVATEALALTDLAEGLSQESDRASPSSAMAPTEPLTDPNTCCPEPNLPAQAVIRVSANYMGCKCIQCLPLHHTLPATMMFTINDKF